tara:strand:- start:3724 stop:4125 length:402 start_codon:yes stop_codon:yes gene_type:complete
MIYLLLSVALAEPLSQEVVKGEPAPYNGRVFNDAAVAEIIAQKEIAKDECSVSLTHQENILNANHDLQMQLLRADLEYEKQKGEKLIALRDEEIERLQENYKPRNALWWAIGGFTVGTLSSLGIYYSVVEINK